MIENHNMRKQSAELLQYLDLSEIGPELSHNEYFAIIYRSERKKTMRAQLEIAEYVKSVLIESKKIQEMKEKKEEALELFKGIYL